MLSIQAYQTSIFDLQHRLLSKNPGEPNQTTDRTTAVNLSSEKKVDISILTAEGDRVTLSAKSEASGSYTTYSSTGVLTNGLSSLENSSLSLATSREISLLVEGDLSEEEMEDIEDLLHKIDSIAKKFFKGDLDKALSKALNMPEFDTIDSLEVHLQYEATSSVSVQHSGVTTMPADQTSSEEPDSPDTTESTDTIQSYLNSSENKGSLTIEQNDISKNVSAQTQLEESTTTEQNGVTTKLVELARFYEFTSSLIVEPPDLLEGLAEQEDSEESSISSIIQAEPEEDIKVSRPVPESSEEVTLLEPVNTKNIPATSTAQEESEDAETKPAQTLSYEKTINVTIQATMTTSTQTLPAEEPITMATIKEAIDAMGKEIQRFGRKGHRSGRKLGRLMNHHFDRMSRSHNHHGAKMKLFQMIKKALMEKIQMMIKLEVSAQLAASSPQPTESSQPASTQQTGDSNLAQNPSNQDQSSIPQLTEEEIENITPTTVLYEGYSTAQYRSHVVTLDATQPEEETVETSA